MTTGNPDGERKVCIARLSSRATLLVQYFLREPLGLDRHPCRL